MLNLTNLFSAYNLDKAPPKAPPPIKRGSKKKTEFGLTEGMVKLYRDAMKDLGWIQVATLAEDMNRAAQGVRITLIKLEAAGYVENRVLPYRGTRTVTEWQWKEGK